MVKNNMQDPNPAETGANRQSTEIDQLKQQVSQQSAKEIKNEFLGLASKASEINQILNMSARGGTLVEDFKGKVEDKDSAKGKAHDVKLAVQKILLSVGDPDKIPTPEGKSAQVEGLARSLIQKVSSRINANQLTEQTAPLFYNLFYRALTGEINNVDNLANAFKNMLLLSFTNPHLFKEVQQSFIDLAKEQGLSEDEALNKFKIEGEGQEDVDSLDPRDPRRKPTPEDWETLEKIQADLNKVLDNIMKNISPDNAEQAQKDRDLIQLFFYGDFNVPEEEITKAFTRRGIPTEYLSEYKRLFNKIHSQKLDRTPFLNDKTLLRRIEEAEAEFKMDSNDFKNKFLEPDSATGRSKILDRQAKLEFKKLITKYYNYGLQRIHKHQSSQFSEAQQDEQQTAYYFADLHSIITSTCESLKNLYANNTEAKRYFDDMSAGYQARIMSLGRTFHDLPLYARVAESFEKWPEFLGYLFPSQLGEIFDPEDRFMEMVRDAITTYIRRRLVQNSNKYPHDLRSGTYQVDGVRYGFRLTDDVKDILVRRMKALGMWEKNEDKEWMLDRAMVYAPGIGIASLNDIEVESTADPVSTFEGINPIMSKISAKANWGSGRGNPHSGLKPAKYLLAMDVNIYPEQKSFFSRLFSKFIVKWAPEKFKKHVDEMTAKYHDELFSQLFDRGGKYQELLNMVNFATSLISRAGWRMRPINDELTTKSGEELGLNPGEAWKNWTRENWNKLWKISLRDYGNASLWWFNSGGPGRLDSLMKRLLVDQLGGINAADEKYGEYAEGELALDKKFKILVDGKEVEENYLYIRQNQFNQLRGESFYHYMRRNPGDFFLLLSQLVPDITKIDTDPKSSGLNDIFLSKHELEVRNHHQKESRTEYDIDKILARQTNIRKRWGDKYFDVLKSLNKWVVGNVGEGKEFKNVSEFIAAIEEESTTASENMRNKNNDLDNANQVEIKKLIEARNKASSEAEVKKINAQIAEVRNRKKLYITKDDYVDIEGEKKAKAVANAIFDDGGLINIITTQKFTSLASDEGNEKFLNNFGDYNKINMDNFFFQMGQAWSLKMGDVNPYSADFNHFAVYNHLGEPGEDLIKRYVGDAVAQSKMLGNIAQLDKLLLHAGHGPQGNFEEIFKLHEEVFMTLKNIIGDDYAKRANNILASIVATYYQEHDITKIPFLRFPFNLPIRMALGNKISLHRILTESMHNYSMDDNAIRTYFNTLQDKEWIPKHGAYSVDQLEEQFNNKTDTFIFGDVGPQFVYFLAMFLVYAYVKRAIEEAEGKKN